MDWSAFGGAVQFARSTAGVYNPGVTGEMHALRAEAYLVIVPIHDVGS
jgi:hypothetical protein